MAAETLSFLRSDFSDLRPILDCFFVKSFEILIEKLIKLEFLLLR